MHFIQNVGYWTDTLFFTSPAPLSEETAIAVAYQHLLGTPSFNIELILGTINNDALAELLDALTTLASKWESREYISKLVAHAMISSSWLFDRVATLFQGTSQQTLQDAERQVNEAIISCLS